MGLVNILPIEPAAPTIEAIQLALLAKTTSKINILFSQMLAVFTSTMTDVWDNPNGLTPQQAFDAFQTNGGELVKLAGLLQGMVNEITPGTLPDSAPGAYITNADGTVTVQLPATAPK